MEIQSFISDATSKHTPAVAPLGPMPYLAWTGEDSQVRLGWYTSEGPVSTRIDQRSQSGPALASDGASLFIAWTGYNEKEIHITSTKDGKGFSTRGTGEYTRDTPALAYFESSTYLAFRGKSNSKIYCKKLSKGKKTTLGDGAVSAPALAVRDGYLYAAWATGSRNIVLYRSRDGSKFEAVKQLANTSDLAPALVASGEKLYLAWIDEGANLTIMDTDGPDSITVTATNSGTAPAAAAVGSQIFLVCTQATNELFCFGTAPSAIAGSAVTPRGAEAEDYIQASVHAWGVQIDLSTQAVADAANGIDLVANMSTAVSAALAGQAAAGASVPLATASAVSGLVAALLLAATAALWIIDRGQGISLLVPWTSLVPLPFPYGPGGVVIPIPR